MKPNVEPTKCDVCGQPAAFVCGCEKCGRAFGECCNSADPDLCVECAV